MPKKRFTPLKTFILGVMNTYNEKNMSGYELIKLSREWRYDHYIKSTKASFYYALKQLERENCIKVIGSKRSKNRPDQTIYKLTPKGRKEFNEQMIVFLKQNQDFFFDIDSTTPFILLFGAINKDGKEVILDCIKNQINYRKSLYNQFEEGEKFIKSNENFDLLPFMILALQHSEFHNDAEIKWLEAFYKMVDGIDFEENTKMLMKRRINVP